jgi:hypothetical protein
MVGTSFNSGHANGYVSGNSYRATGSSWGTAAGAAVQKQNSRFAVVKYLEDDKPRSAAEAAPVNTPQAANPNGLADQTEPSAQ